MSIYPQTLWSYPSFPVSEFLIYKFPEEEYLTAKEVVIKRREEFKKQNPKHFWYFEKDKIDDVTLFNH